MKIKVSEIGPCPFRDMNKYPIIRDKVESLKRSIEETEFWDNLVCRKNGDGYQIPYGHHRLTAIQELGIEEIDIPVKNLSDITMLKMMAYDNMSQYELDPMVTHETIRSVRNFLNFELSKYETWEDFQKSDLINLLEQKTEKSFNKVKAGVGQTTILKFLPGYKQWVVQEVLNTLKDEDIDESIVDSLNSMEKVKNFKRSAKKYKIPKENQKEIADKIKNEDITNIEDFIKAEMHIDEAQEQINVIGNLADDISNSIKLLNTQIAEFNTMAELAGVQNIAPGWVSECLLSELFDMLGNSERMLGYFGLNLKNQYNKLNENNE